MINCKVIPSYIGERLECNPLASDDQLNSALLKTFPFLQTTIPFMSTTVPGSLKWFISLQGGYHT